MKTKAMPRLTSFVLALSLLLTACGGGTSAATMHLRKTEGTVGVSDGEGKDVTPKDNLGLYSGYQVGTQAESYAWIDLDSVKLTKLDENSEIAITKEGKKLDIEVKAGSLFFNVTEPLADDESMNIRTSSMLVGIRGTCGWVTQDTAALLEGTVEVTAGEQSVTVTAGEMAYQIEDGTLEVVEFSDWDIPDFVWDELDEDEDLAAKILEDSGIDPGEESVYPLHVATSQKLYDADGTLIFHHAIEYDELGYETRSVTTFNNVIYDPRSVTDFSTDITNFTNDLEAGTFIMTAESYQTEGQLRFGIIDRMDGTFSPDGSYISCNPLDWESAQRLAELRANGGRFDELDSELENYYTIYSFGESSDFPISCVTYTTDGVMTGYAEFEWAVIDPS